MASGTIAYCSREDHVWPSFTTALARLVQRHPDVKLVHPIGVRLAHQRNAAVQEMDGDWIWFIDTDMIFPANTLERLLAHNVPVVQALCMERHPPHEPILWTQAADRRDAVPVGRPRLVDGVKAVGAGGTLYRRAVFDVCPAPWFEGDHEDGAFAKKIRESKRYIMCADLATPVGHITPMVIWPDYDPRAGTWGVRYQTMNGLNISLPALTQPAHVKLV